VQSRARPPQPQLQPLQPQPHGLQTRFRSTPRTLLSLAEGSVFSVKCGSNPPSSTNPIRSAFARSAPITTHATRTINQSVRGSLLNSISSSPRISTNILKVHLSLLTRYDNSCPPSLSPPSPILVHWWARYTEDLPYQQYPWECSIDLPCRSPSRCFCNHLQPIRSAGDRGPPPQPKQTC